MFDYSEREKDEKGGGGGEASNVDRMQLTINAKL